MGEPYELKFAGLRAGAAYFLTADAITGGPHAHMEFLATQSNVFIRWQIKSEAGEDVREEQRALAAFDAEERIRGWTSQK